MPRTAKPSDFVINLPGVGDFVFGRRTFRDHAAIRAEYLRINGDEEDNELNAFVTLIVIMKTLCVSAPRGWEDIESMEMDNDRHAKAFELLRLFNEQEDSFWQGAIEGSEAPRPGAGE